jgi:hypothetical protein
MTTQQAMDDLRYLRQAVRPRRALITDAAPIAWVWAIYVLVGYPLLDFAPKAGGIFLAFGGLFAGLLSALLGRWMSRRAGEADPAGSTRQALHWSSIAVGVIAAMALALTGQIDASMAGQVSVLAVAMVYLTAGAHYDRWFFVLGAILAIGAVGVGLMPALGWTTLGALLALGLIAPTLLPRREAEAL